MKSNKLGVLLGVAFLLFSGGVAFGGQKSPKPATSQEDSFMFGRILGAVEDVGGGYTKEALHKFSSINKDLEKRRYSPRTVWLGHRYYGEALLKAGKREDAMRMLEIAQTDAAALTAKEQAETAELLQRAKTTP